MFILITAVHTERIDLVTSINNVKELLLAFQWPTLKDIKQKKYTELWQIAEL